MKKALIFGISGQDGAYLTELLLGQGYQVCGASRDAQMSGFGNLVKLGLRETVEEFSRRGRLPVELDCADWRCALSPNEQIHVMQIVREALNNSVQHARANRITVRLQGPSTGEVVVSIGDDGVGLPAKPERENHFGLNIMRERTQRLGGTLELQARPAGGLLVLLRFIPIAQRRLGSQD